MPDEQTDQSTEIAGLKAELARLRKLNQGHEAEVARLKAEAKTAAEAEAKRSQEQEGTALLTELGLDAEDAKTAEVVDLLRHLHSSIEVEEGKQRPTLLEHARALREADHWLLRGVGKPPPKAPVAPKAKAPPPPERKVDPKAKVELTPESIARMTDDEWKAAKASIGGSFGDALAGRAPAT